MFIQADIVQVRVVDHPLSHILWFLLSLGSRLTTSSPGLFGFRAFFDDSPLFFLRHFIEYHKRLSSKFCQRLQI